MGRTRLTALILALTVSAVAILAAGCGGGDSTTGESGGGEKLTVGSDVPYPPFEEFGQSKSEFTGFDVELMEAIGEKIGREVEFQDTSFDTIFRDLAQGKFEAVASATTITPEREKTVDFTNPYYLSEQAILIKEGGAVNSLKKLDGATIGVQQGTTGEEFVEEKVDAGEVRPYPQGPEAVSLLKAGVVDAVVIDIPVAENAVKSQSGLEVAEAIPTEEEYGLAVAQGDEELLDSLNEGLEQIKDDGTFAEIYEKWFKRAPNEELMSASHEAT